MGEMVSTPKLLLGYKKSEAKLNKAAKRGDVGSVEKEMRSHHEYEYALLYQKVLRSQKKQAKSKNKLKGRKKYGNSYSQKR